MYTGLFCKSLELHNKRLLIGWYSIHPNNACGRERENVMHYHVYATTWMSHVLWHHVTLCNIIITGVDTYTICINYLVKYYLRMSVLYSAAPPIITDYNNCRVALISLRLPEDCHTVSRQSQFTDMMHSVQYVWWWMLQSYHCCHHHHPTPRRHQGSREPHSLHDTNNGSIISNYWRLHNRLLVAQRIGCHKPFTN